MSTAIAHAASEEALREFLRTLPPELAPRVRSLAHAWTAAGGALQVGRFTVRLLAATPRSRQFTAGTLHASHGDAGPALELSRVLILNNGVSPADWSAWSDELAELQTHGFLASAKFPTVTLRDLPEAVAARLAQGLRDLGRLAQGQPV